MDEINLQDKTKATPGIIESYWFENPNIGLKNTEFHSIEIPLKPFDSGLSYEEQPLETIVVFDWFKLNLEDPSQLEGLNLNHENYPEAEASVYVGCSHNWCQIKELSLNKIGHNAFEVSGKLFVEFENENVAKNELFTFSTTAKYSERA